MSRDRLGVARAGAVSVHVSWLLVVLGGCTGVITSPSGADRIPATGSGGAPDSPNGAGGSPSSAAETGGAGSGAPSATGGSPAASTPDACASASDSLDVPMRRLSPDEWLATARAALGNSVPDVRTSLPQPSATAPYTTYPDASRVDGAQARTLMEVAESVGQALAPSLTNCDSGTFASCAKTVIGNWATIAFRRPPESADVDALVATATAAKADGLVPSEALATAAIALLQHPSFLYLVDSHAGVTTWTLDDYERAQRLAYTLWRAPVDSYLASQAKAGSLKTVAGFAAGVDHTLNDPQIGPAFRRFIKEWLGLASLPDSFAADVRTSLETELGMLADHLLDAPDAMAAAFQGDLGYANTTLETFYGLPHQSTGTNDFKEVHIEGRAGLLTHPLVMAKAAHGEVSSVILRGKLVRLNILCGALGSPPAGAQALEPLGADATPRQRYEARKALPQCAGCHTLMDPVGFAFESFDGLGRHRTQVNGQPVDDAAEVAGTQSTNGTVRGADELGRMLSGSDEVATCFARQWFRYAYGQSDQAIPLACSATDAASTFISSGRSARTLLRAFAEHPSFVQRGAQQ